MKKITCILIIVALISCVSLACADNGLLGNFIESLVTDNTIEIRGSLHWGMNADEVYKALVNEKHNGKNMCTNVEIYPSWANRTINWISAEAVLGNFKPIMYCAVSDLWGLYYIEYYFSSQEALSKEEYEKWGNQTEEEFLTIYETMEKTLNYVYGMGDRPIDKWGDRATLQDKYYIIKTSWNKGGTTILLECYKDAGRIELKLEYDSPDYSDYNKRIEQDLKVTNSDMFYGF